MSTTKSILKLGIIWSSIILLGATLLIRLVDQLKLLTHFPGGFINDLSSYLAQLYFLDVCGFHQFCSYWYNGFTAFLITPPGWFFFTYPFYVLFGDVKIAAYISFLLILLFSYLVIHFFGKKLKIPTLYRIFFFLVIFANANSIRGFLRSGRPHELLSWLFFLILFFIIIYYSTNKITLPFYTTSIIYAATIITYFSVAVFASFLFLSLFLIKKKKEQLFVVLAMLLGFLLSSFWLVPFFMNIQNTFLSTFFQNEWLLSLELIALPKQIGAFIFPLAFMTLFYISWKTKKEKQHLLFYAPFILLGSLLLFRITAFLPVFQYIPANHYFTLFIFLACYLYITLKEKETKIYTFINLGLLVAVVISTVISLFFTAYYEVQNQDTQDILELLPHIEERYMAIGLYPKDVYSKPLTAYAAIYHDLDNAIGWYPHVKGQSYFTEVDKLQESYEKQNCELFIQQLETLNTPEVLSHAGCDFLASCSMVLKIEQNEYCLYSHSSKSVS